MANPFQNLTNLCLKQIELNKDSVSGRFFLCASFLVCFLVSLLNLAIGELTFAFSVTIFLVTFCLFLIPYLVEFFNFKQELKEKIQHYLSNFQYLCLLSFYDDKSVEKTLKKDVTLGFYFSENKLLEFFIKLPSEVVLEFLLNSKNFSQMTVRFFLILEIFFCIFHPTIFLVIFPTLIFIAMVGISYVLPMIFKKGDRNA